MNRRRFLHTITGILAAGSPSCGWTRLSVPDVSTFAQTGLLSFLGDEECICAIGQAYRNKYPNENNLSALVDTFVSEQTHTNLLSDLYLHDYIDSMIRQDFEQDDTVLLSGWVLSRTEARQTALYSILHS